MAPADIQNSPALNMQGQIAVGVLTESQKKVESVLDSIKEVLPYIVFKFFFIF